MPNGYESMVGERGLKLSGGKEEKTTTENKTKQNGGNEKWETRNERKDEEKEETKTEQGGMTCLLFLSCFQVKNNVFPLLEWFSKIRRLSFVMKRQAHLTPVSSSDTVTKYFMVFRFRRYFLLTAALFCFHLFFVCFVSVPSLFLFFSFVISSLRYWTCFIIEFTWSLCWSNNSSHCT